jgi:pyruvate/2-oxoglutarate dehydrogenase complex dihydrolipoamide dehydrogenase (E3) component
MTKAGGAVEKGETRGFMKIIFNAQTHEILEAAILGAGADRFGTHPTMLGEIQPLSDGAGAPQ